MKKQLNNKIRRKILEMIATSKSGHIASSFSIVEILLVLYFGILKINPLKPKDPDRDRFILSKAHGCAALYTVLAECGFFSSDILKTFCQFGSILGGHPEKGKVPGIEASAGSLGHGLSMGAGIALAAKRDFKNYRVFVLLSDGECNEGSIWEAVLFAAQYKLDNLIAIIDCNKFQASGRTDKIISLEPLTKKWESFGWKTVNVNGHNEIKLLSTLNKVPFSKGKPSVIIAHTIKGKGVSFMENNPAWHTGIPDGNTYYLAKEELK
jgi:transketolase